MTNTSRQRHKRNWMLRIQNSRFLKKKFFHSYICSPNSCKNYAPEVSLNEEDRMKSLIKLFFSSALVGLVFVLPALAKTPTPTLTPTSMPAPCEHKVEYLLTYPGILPDHPLYFLKTLRDRILEALIVDPLRKSEFYLLQADKRLNMGIFFGAKGKALDAAESMTTAEQFMERTVAGLVTFRNSGSQVPASMVDRLEKSIGKHVEVLEDMVTNAGQSERQILERVLETVRRLQGEVGKLK